MEHFLSMKDLSEHEILRLLKEAEAIKNGGQKPFEKQLFVGNLFFEPSTRTKMSFTIAERRLGFESLDFTGESSSLVKGESIYDTARTFEAIGASLLVIRHPEENMAARLAADISIPIINAGDGAGEHPTQSLLDLMTIHQEFKRFSGLRIAIAGDIKHSRVARSNAFALQTLGAEVYLSCKPEWEDRSLPYPYVSIDEAAEMCDVVMLLRIQHERHGKNKGVNPADYLRHFGLTVERERSMQPHAIILHPAPVNRGVEIEDELVECPRSRIFKQMENGVFARMAVMKHLLKDRGIIDDINIDQRDAISSR
ncbi:aspartate carbamoyltransferase catalytic subunit [Sediminibacillus dalangtanensis]|uniref:Aspartate carbamoyltransferase n=1 Tax=Sediminibacillus dalangtanensis TaxID=2729421 RepID=A0ABX7VS48_9BACI|nr:aspartate carbamoyltransferase catalytic subunit [Sediminibacillus dalangtanensis]QTM99353.1 aspartate carbamoyltransferase catalytic subunit [Sediminibacillus dalangtanensis]